MGRDTVMAQDATKAALAAWHESGLLQEMCEANGVTRDEFLYNRHQIEGLELFLTAMPTMVHVKWFTGLVKLQIIHQEVTIIEGLDQLENLEYLWLNENNISKIQGLDNCTRLKELYLYSNNIPKIEGLTRLTNLEVLWLHDNQISEVTGLSRLVNLRVLWLASNLLTRIGHSLDNLVKLEEVNLSNNLIGSFREIPHLDRLPNLTHLYFSDPHFGDNPICQLCNYQTYTLYHLNRLTVLDYTSVSEESRHLAEATFIKKKMYYNMRIKTLRRNTSNLVKKAVQFKQCKLSEVNLSLNVLVRMAKEIERDVEEAKLFKATDVPIHELEGKLRTVRETINQKNNEIAEIENRFTSMKDTIDTISNDNISRLLVELQTGGNIRMEEGKLSDVWYQSCMDLVRSRFFASDFEKYGIRDIRITKVTRIHNRYLRNRFEDKLETMIDVNNQAYKAALEYLFYGEDPELPGELTSAIEGGFRPPSEYEAFGKDSGVPVSNSVFLAEQSRLLKLQREGLLDKHGDGIMGRVLITKVFLGKAAHAKEAPGSPRSQLVTPLTAAASAKVKRKDYPQSVGSVYREVKDDPKQRTWFCFDQEMALPEYLVEFLYLPTATAAPNKLPIATLADYSTDERLNELKLVINKLVPTKNELDATDIRSYAHYFLAFIHHCNTIVGADKEFSCELLASSPVVKQRPKIAQIDPESIKKAGHSDALTEVTYLNLFGNHIKKIEYIPQCVNLRNLVLSFNEIQRLEGICDLPHLQSLDLSFNLIKRVEGLKGLPSLVKLELNNNLIYRLEDVNVIKKLVPTVTDLSLKNNAICDVKSYKYIVLRRVTGLRYFDGKEVTAEEIQLAQDKLSPMTHAMIAQHTHTQPTLGWALNLQPNLGCSSMHWKDTLSQDHDGEAGPQPAGDMDTLSGSDDGKMVLTRKQEMTLVKAVEVNCPKMRIRKMENLDKCRDLRRLTMSDNELSRIEGLENCLKLEELYLDENRITRIESLSLLVNLRKLELGKNKINKIEGLECLVNLCQLSLEDNDIYSLQGIQRVPNLMELYIGNNKIDSLKEVNYLRDIPKLIILDLSGNPLCFETEYRLFTVFSIKKLKVLDGASIDITESTKAKETFAGKMNTELLVDKVGKITEWAKVTELNLSGCSIRELSMLEQFPSLLHFKCDHNMLSNVTGLKCCTSLLSLNLNSNRLSSSPEATTGRALPSLGSCLEQMSLLESLSLEGNHITSISALGLKLKNLRFLNLRSNDITKIDGLEGVPQLSELILDRNKLRGVEDNGLLVCHHLRDLRLEDNMIKRLDGLKGLQNLNRLFVTANRISDLSELEKLDGLDRLTEVYLTGNAVARKSLYRATLVHRLRNCLVIDGREVSPDEREKAELFFNQEYYTYQHPPNVYTDRQTVPTAGTAQPQPTQNPIIGPKGAVKLISFEYHDTPTQGGALYHSQTDKMATPTRVRNSGPASNGIAPAVAKTTRTSSADGTGRMIG
eukprot:TRINITY_DN8290_c0_g1_i2.p1 TRINITY_DN8290_c0_g1~~TRINITY_DN8290_c0_g1_i2.p1  ORF type:complete len:1479 (+),score=580.35 TRINITY_DN8290_c0_g1_i2:85-4521(+)